MAAKQNNHSETNKKRLWLLSLLAVACMSVALALGVVLGDEAVRLLPAALPDFAQRLIPASLVTVCVFVVLALLCRYTGTSWRSIGFRDVAASAKGFLLGFGVVSLAAAVLFAAGTLAGWLSWGDVDAGRLVVFLVTNGIIALLIEALPEESVLRGFIGSRMRSAYRFWIAALGTTAFFLVAAALISFIIPILEALISGAPLQVTFLPGGQDPFTYFFILFLFGLLLMGAREATKSLTIWTAVAAHLAFLTINRITFAGSETTGVSVTHLDEWALILYPAYVLAALAIFRYINKRLHGSSYSERPRPLGGSPSGTKPATDRK